MQAQPNYLTIHLTYDGRNLNLTLPLDCTVAQLKGAVKGAVYEHFKIEMHRLHLEFNNARLGDGLEVRQIEQSLLRPIRVVEAKESVESKESCNVVVYSHHNALIRQIHVEFPSAIRPTVSDIKNKASTCHDIPIHRQRATVRGRILDDSTLLAYVGRNPDDTIDIVDIDDKTIGAYEVKVVVDNEPGKHISMAFSSRQDVASIKEMLESQTRIPASRQLLNVGGVVLQDSEIFQNVNGLITLFDLAYLESFGDVIDVMDMFDVQPGAKPEILHFQRFPGWTVLDLKQEISRYKNIQVNAVSLTFKGESLVDHIPMTKERIQTSGRAMILFSRNPDPKAYPLVKHSASQPKLTPPVKILVKDFFNGLDGVEVEFEVTPIQTYADLKRLIADKLGYPTAHQSLHSRESIKSESYTEFLSDVALIEADLGPFEVYDNYGNVRNSGSVRVSEEEILRGDVGHHGSMRLGYGAMMKNPIRTKSPDQLIREPKRFFRVIGNRDAPVPVPQAQKAPVVPVPKHREKLSKLVSALEKTSDVDILDTIAVLSGLAIEKSKTTSEALIRENLRLVEEVRSFEKQANARNHDVYKLQKELDTKKADFNTISEIFGQYKTELLATKEDLKKTTLVLDTTESKRKTTELELASTMLKLKETKEKLIGYRGKKHDSQRKENECSVCLDGPPIMAFVPCGHLAVCGDCVKSLRKCPICNTVSTGSLRIFTC